MQIIIRPAISKDFKQVQSVQLSGGDTVISNGDAIEIEDMELQASNPNGIFGVAEQDGKIIGFIYGEKLCGRWAMASYFVVAPEYRGGEAYKKLGEWFANRAKRLGAKYLFLYADSDNEKLIKFYEHFGFVAGNNYIEMIKEI
jgi:GNAT superfamily N-acetyltransferase